MFSLSSLFFLARKDGSLWGLGNDSLRGIAHAHYKQRVACLKAARRAMSENSDWIGLPTDNAFELRRVPGCQVQMDACVFGCVIFRAS
jgi:hypothetical protein